jgi:hypothetical protein
MAEEQKTPKDWWAPVWKGLVADQEGKHYRRMKNAVWLFLYFVTHADRKTGTLKRKCRTICEQMGLSAKTARKWLKSLKTHGYVKAWSNGRCLEIQILKWKPIGESSRCGTQSAQTGVLRLPQLGESEKVFHCQNLSRLSQKTAEPLDRNEIMIKRKRINDNMGDAQVFDSNSNAFEGMDQIVRKYLLAFYLAKDLNDEPNLSWYLSLSKRYPESLLIRVLEKVKQVPDAKIKKGRGAFFNYLIQKYDHKTFNDSRD